MEASMWIGEPDPKTNKSTAEILTVWCQHCDDKLHSDEATDDIVMCSCTFTVIDHGVVRLNSMEDVSDG
jgi:hypothetical protein